MLLFLTTNMAAVTSRANQQLQYPQHRSLNDCEATRKRGRCMHLLKAGNLARNLRTAFDWTYHFSHVKKTSFTILIGRTVSFFSRVKNIAPLFG